MDTQTTKKSDNRLKKEQIVAELVERVDNSKGLVFANFEGLTHKQLESLKTELKRMDSTIVIAKNSLIKLSLEQSKNYSEFKDNEGLNLPTATLFIQGDMVEPLKSLQKLIKELNLPKIKFGILEGQLVDEKGVLKIASLPSRETLIAQFVGTLNSPIQGLVVTLNGPIQKLALVLNAVAQNKPTTPAPATTETPVVEEAPKTEETPETAEELEAEAQTEAEAPNNTAEQTNDSAEEEKTEAVEETPETAEETKEDKNEGGEN